VIKDLIFWFMSIFYPTPLKTQAIVSNSLVVVILSHEDHGIWIIFIFKVVY